MIKEDFRRSAGSAFSSVDDDHVGSGLGGDRDVVSWTGSADLHKDRNPVAGCFSQFLYLDLEIVCTQEIRMTNG